MYARILSSPSERMNDYGNGKDPHRPPARSLVGGNKALGGLVNTTSSMLVTIRRIAVTAMRVGPTTIDHIYPVSASHDNRTKHLTKICRIIMFRVTSRRSPL